MRKLLTLAGLMLLAGLPAHAQFSRIIGITERQNDNSLAAYYASPFTIKAGANCSWSISGTVSTFNCSGGAAASVPFSGVTAGTNTNALVIGTGGSLTTSGTGTITATNTNVADGKILYSAAGVISGINQTNSNVANADGSGDPADIFFTQTNTFTYYMAGTNTSAPMGNFWGCANETDGGVYCDASDATDVATLGIAPGSGNSGLSVLHSAKSTGFDINSINRVIETSRIAFTTTLTSAPTSFSLGAGWGSTASVGSIGGSDNAFVFTVTTGGSGIAANPTVTYTYVDGDYSTASASVPVFVCTQTGGSDIIGDMVPLTPGQTTVAMTWYGTPTTAKTYTFSCHDFQRS